MKKFIKELTKNTTATDYYLDSITFQPAVTILNEGGLYIGVNELTVYTQSDLKDLIAILSEADKEFDKFNKPRVFKDPEAEEKNES